MFKRLFRRTPAPPATDPYIAAVQLQEAQEAMVEQIVAREVAELRAQLAALAGRVQSLEDANQA